MINNLKNLTSLEKSPKERWIDGAGLHWLYLDMNSYFASCEQHDNVKFRGKPLIVVPLMSDYTSVIAASYEAKAFGIKTGTSVKEAKQLCPNIQVVEARPNRYTQLHNAIKEEIDKIIPIEKTCSIDEFACILMGPQKLENEARKIGYAVQRIIMENIGVALTSSIGIAPSMLLAKTAADMKKPLGLTLLRMDSLPGDLLRLEIDDFAGIGVSMSRRLRAADVNNVSQLWAQSPIQLRQIWGGIVGEYFWKALHGIDPPEIETTRSSVSHSHVLAPALRPVAQAHEVARRLVAKCGSRLRRMGYKTTKLHLSIRGEKHGRAQSMQKFTATADSFALLKTCDILWENCTSELHAKRLRKVSVTCMNLLAPETSPSLFDWSDFDENPKHMRILSALDKLNQSYGKDTITIGPKTAIPHFVGAKIAFNRIPEAEEFRE